MVRRGEITDQAWQEIEPLLSEYGQSGGQWRDHRTVINGILWKLRTGSPWSDAVREIEWEVSVDDTVVRAHQHAAGARRKPTKGEDAKGSS
jgi:transposase